jgi:hypothetical protein
MDDSKGWDSLPRLDDDFVRGAAHREPTHRHRMLEAERQRARQRAGEARSGYRDGLEGDLGGAPRRRRGPDGPSRTRQLLGLLIAVAVLAAAVYLPARLHGNRVLFLAPSPAGAPPGACPADLYPAGAAYRFEQCANGTPLGWARCSTLTVSVDPAGAPAGWRTDTGVTLKRLAAATGLRLTVVPSRRADVSIRWTSSFMQPGPAADKAGLTRVVFRTNRLGAEIASAAIQISGRLTSGGGRHGEVPVLLHELAHAVGLGHFDGPEVMNPVDQGFAAYRSGDLAGLASLYDPQGCRRP